MIPVGLNNAHRISRKQWTECAYFCKRKKCPCFVSSVSLALLKLHCVSKITSSHLCLQSIPHLDAEHFIPLHGQQSLLPQIASASYGMPAFCYKPGPPLAPFLFSASHSMYTQLILLVSASNTPREHLECWWNLKRIKLNKQSLFLAEQLWYKPRYLRVNIELVGSLQDISICTGNISQVQFPMCL